jgi:hypothetical protein
MTIEKIMEFWRRQPFLPFDLRVSDGRVYTVDQPEFLIRSRHGRTVTFTTEDDREIVIDVGHITSLEVANTRAA